MHRMVDVLGADVFPYLPKALEQLLLDSEVKMVLIGSLTHFALLFSGEEWDLNVSPLWEGSDSAKSFSSVITENYIILVFDLLFSMKLNYRKLL